MRNSNQSIRSFIGRVGFLVLMVALWSGQGAFGQIIPIKTAPVATGDQFQIFPAHNRGMGDLTIAVDDPMGDVFVNPAKAARLDGSRPFSSPVYYTITGRDGAARTLPVGAILSQGRWFGGFGVALQQLETTDPTPPVVGFPADAVAFSSTVVGPQPLREESANNQYATGFAGLRVSETISVAGRVFWAGLNAMEGVDLLYPQSQRLQQDGHRLDVRLGLLGEWKQRSFSMLLVHDRIDMTHDVGYVDAFWNADVEQWITQVRDERYFDRTNTWGLHLEYVQPLGSDGWRLGSVVTGNRKGHPKIPNYELMNIPRDPGTSWAYNFGFGLARTYENTTFGVDVVYEPIFSDTWATAAERTPLPDGTVIPEGGRTVENDFDFANTTLRAGLRRDGKWTELQLGLEVHTIRYWLKQQNHVEGFSRDQHEAWSEWTLTWGGGLRLSDLHIRYTGRLTTGTGRPGITRDVTAEANFAAASDIILAPRGPLTLQETSVFTHQVTVSIPIGVQQE